MDKIFFRHKRIVKPKSMTEATQSVHKKTKKYLEKIKKEAVKVGKTHVRGGKKLEVKVGKTHAHGGKKPFDIDNPKTWVHTLKEKVKDVDGLVVIAAIDDNAVPKRIRKEGFMDDAEDYALRLRDCIAKKFNISKQPSGSRAQRKPDIFIVYVAYKLIGERLIQPGMHITHCNR